MSLLRRSALSEALSLFCQDNDRNVYLSGTFGSLEIYLAINNKSSLKHHRCAQRHLHAVSQDIWNIATLVERLEWSRHWAIENDDINRWRIYAQLDIAHIWYEFRSLLDHIACAFGELSQAPGTMPESFEKLVNNRERYRAPLGAMYTPLSRDFTWFYDLRAMRTAVAHRGAEPVVFGDPEHGILFQLHNDNYRKLILVPEFMHNPNVVMFEPYIAYHFAELLSLLEAISVAAVSHIHLNAPMRTVKSYCPGYDQIVVWMKDLQRKLDASEI